MAKPTKGKNGIWSILARFQKKYRRLTLGRIPKNQAELFATNLRVLIDYRKRDAILHPDTCDWIGNLSRIHFEQLGAIGLVHPSDRSLTVNALIRMFLNDYRLRRDNGEIKPSTYRAMQTKLGRFPEWFCKLQLSELEPTIPVGRPNAKPEFTDSAKKIFQNLESYFDEKYATATWSRGNQNMIEVGIWAIKCGHICCNPFTLLRRPGESNQLRNVEVDSGIIIDAIEQEPNVDVRTMLALGRFLGIRLSSEARTLKWDDVNWEQKTVSIKDSKSKNRIRVIPMFEQVEKALIEQWEMTPKDARFVFSTEFLRSKDSHHYQCILRAIKRIGHEPWERLRQNLRSTCEHDWRFVHNHPESLVDTWIGHSRKVSKQHYQQQRESDVREAIKRANQSK